MGLFDVFDIFEDVKDKNNKKKETREMIRRAKEIVKESNELYNNKYSS